MKKYTQKVRPSFKIPGKDNPKRDLVIGAIVLFLLFCLVIIIGRKGIFGETLQEYGERTNQIQTKIEESSKNQ